MVQLTSTLILATMVAVPALSAPLAVDATQYSGREFDESSELAARGQTMSRMAGKTAENVFDAYGQNKAKEAIKKYTNQPPNVDPKLAEAAKKASGPFNPAFVQATIGFKKGTKKRDLEDLDMYEREFDEDVLEARGQTMSRVAVKTAENVFDAYGQNKAKEAIKKYTNPPANVDPRLAAAAKKASGPFNPAFVQAAIGFKKGIKKRDLEDSDMYERDFDEDVLEARGQTMSRMAGKAAENVFDAYGQNKAKEAIKKYTSQPPNVDPRLAAAAKKASGPFNPAFVQAAIGFKKGTKKRDLEDLNMYERDFDEDVLEARGQTMSRVAVKTAENVFDAYGQNKAKEAIKKYTNPPANVDPRLAAAAKKASGPFNPAFVQAAIGFKKGIKKRDFDNFEDVFERDFDDFDSLVERELDELVERGYYELEDLD